MHQLIKFQHNRAKRSWDVDFRISPAHLFGENITVLSSPSLVDWISLYENSASSGDHGWSPSWGSGVHRKLKLFYHAASMQGGLSHQRNVCLSVCLSNACVKKRKNFYRDSYTVWKAHLPDFWQEKWLKIGVFARTESDWPKISGRSKIHYPFFLSKTRMNGLSRDIRIWPQV